MTALSRAATSWRCDPVGGLSVSCYDDPSAKEPAMVQLAEHDVAPATIEATVNYLADTGETPFTYTGGPGSTEVRTGGTRDPHQVVMRNGRLHPGGFDAGARRLPLCAATTPGWSISSMRTKCSAVYYPEMEALIKAESGAKRVVVFDHTLRTADDDDREARQDPRARAARAQRLHRMVGPAARARPPAGRGRRSPQAPLRHHPGVAADPSSGREPIRSRSAMRAALRPAIS